jgi:hypothetical protein
MSDSSTPNADEAEAISRLRGAHRKRSRKGEPVDWIAVREEYVTGAESYEAIAKRLGVDRRTVERQAADDGWLDARAAFREDVNRRFRIESAQRQIDASLSVMESQVKHVAALVEAAMPGALEALGSGLVGGADAVKLAIAALRAQSRVHGLDRVNARVELTGKDGAAIKHDVSLGPVDDRLAVVAERALEALFGEAPDQG